MKKSNAGLEGCKEIQRLTEFGWDLLASLCSLTWPVVQAGAPVDITNPSRESGKPPLV